MNLMSGVLLLAVVVLLTFYIVRRGRRIRHQQH